MRPSSVVRHIAAAVVAMLLASPVIWLEAQDPTRAADTPWLRDVTTESGLDAVHRPGATGAFLIPEIIGAGVALADLDNDGDLDVVLIQSGDLSGRAGTAGAARARHGVWRNDLHVAADGTRHLRFVDVSTEAGLEQRGYGMGVTTGDYDGDGLIDLYVTALGHNALYRNRGGLRFEDVTAQAGVDDDRWGTSAAFADLDGDGALDLFVANYLDFSEATSKPCFEPAGAQDYCTPTRYRPVPDRLFRNRGDGTFTDATEAAGIGRAFGNGLGVAVRDYDGDGRPDVYVANDATPNQLWRNLGGLRFEDVGPLSGAAFNALGRVEGSMGIAAADVDHDGDADLAVTNIIGETFVLYRNDGRGGFDDERVATGLSSATATMTGFGAEWFDADNDGVLDLVTANGAVNVLPPLRGSANPYRQRNQLFRGVLPGRDGSPSRPDAEGRDGSPSRPDAEGRDGSPSRPGAAFRLHELTGAAAGPAFDLLEVSRGLAVGDLDNDGWPDVVITNNGGPARVLRNVAPRAHAWVGLDLRQPGPNPLAIGATVHLDEGPAARRTAMVHTDGSYLSASDPRLLFGLGDHRGTVSATVTWPDGTRERFEGLATGQYHRITRR